MAARLARGPTPMPVLQVLFCVAIFVATGASSSSSAANKPKDCPHTTQHAWQQHCASADDCTSEPGNVFCTCCIKHGVGSEWDEACAVMCGANYRNKFDQLALQLRTDPTLGKHWRFDDFGEGGPQSANQQHGPFFEQPTLSLVGDAAVVLGDCYNVDMRANQIKNRAGEAIGTTACLVPPVPRKLYSSDAHLSLNVSVCSSQTAPYHAHNLQPAALAAMLCFDECHVRNLTQPPEPPIVVDEDALTISNCTRTCFASCVKPIAAECSSLCDAANYSCFGECHLYAQTCSVPMGPRDVRFLRTDPNHEVCHNPYSEFEGCVSECSEGCHTKLKRSKRTVHDDIDDWYNASCSPPLERAASDASSCLVACQDNCTSYCNETVIAPLGPTIGLGPPLTNCTKNCTDYCLDELCFTPEARYEYVDGCRPKAPYNCSSFCFDGLTCPVLVEFCSVYDVDGQLRHVDPNCTDTGGNYTFQASWGNASVHLLLADPASTLSQFVGVNGTVHVCYNDCWNASGTDLFFHGSILHVGENCTTLCYARTCIDSCLDNCTVEEEFAALPPCPGAGTPLCFSPTNCSVQYEWGNCSAVNAFELLRLQSTYNGGGLVNISAVTENVTAYVPPWDETICLDLASEAIGAMYACASGCRELCDFQCPPPANVTMDANGVYTVVGDTMSEVVGGVLYNDTSGECMAQCHSECTTNCSIQMIASVSAAWCVTPAEPIEYCTPPTGCTDDCAHECLDPTYLLATDPECEEHQYKVMPNGDNLTVVLLPYIYNLSTAPECSRNATELPNGNCSSDLLFFNVTERFTDVMVSEGCVRRCAERCAAQCFERYCMTRLEEPVNETAVCLPRCLERFYEEPTEEELSTGPDGGETGYGVDGLNAAAVGGGGPSQGGNGTYCYEGTCHTNLTDCQLMCDAECLVLRSLNCTSLCDHLIEPAAWNGCVASCIGNASATCAQDCTYTCTSNHTFAYGFPMPYDASGDYFAGGVDLHLAWSPAGVLKQHLHSGVWDTVPPLWDTATLGPWSYETSNASFICHQNCTMHCAEACFVAAQASGVCEQQKAAAAQALVAASLPPLHPSEAAAAYNNCTLAQSSSCLLNCHADCTAKCANLTDVVPPSVALDIQIAQVYDQYVEHCEDKCRIQIYGKNVTSDEECLHFQGLGSGAFNQGCLDNCTFDARLSCMNPNITVDVVDTCNATCIHLYIDPSSIEVTNSSLGAYDYLGEAIDLPPPPPPPIPGQEFNLNAAYDACMGHCHGNYTSNPSYICDGGVGRLEALAAWTTYYTAAEDGYGQQGITPQEQMQIDSLQAAIPKGEVCTFVDIGCVANSTLGCDDYCAEQVHSLYMLCVFRYQARRNATFDYNISSCIHPDGWRVGSDKWRFFAAMNATSPLALPSAHSQSPVWQYSDVDDNTILNCTCHFLNETFDPEFVAAIIEYEMRPFRNHYLSTCLCLFNATVNEPQHCVQSNFSNVMNVFDWVFGNNTASLDTVDPLEAHVESVGSCGAGCVTHCVSHCGAYFVEHITPDDDRYNGSIYYVGNVSLTFRMTGFPLSLADWNQSNADGTYTIVPGHWRSHDACFQPCMQTCSVVNCTLGCVDGCREDVEFGNETAQAFGCFWNATHEEGRPLCGQYCDCYESCAMNCVNALPSFNTSLQMLDYFPSCTMNCSTHCEAVHDQRCANITAMLIAANMPKYVNQTEVCLQKIFPTCSLHCLGISLMNITVNNSLFASSFLPPELLSLNITAGFDPEAEEGYKCVIEPCVDGQPCNSTAIQIGEETVVEPISGNVSVVPVMLNVTTLSYEGCKYNRSSACLDTCTEVGYLVCVPETDPFDLCVQSCVANLTYIEPPYAFDQSLAVCKKKLRLTPSQSDRRGAAWYRDKQPVREGFRSSFAFKLDHQSKRCRTVAHPSHEQKAEANDLLCRTRGGDGFAFVIQDAGVTSLSADCAFNVSQSCVDNEAQVCIDLCKTLCPSSVLKQTASCLQGCLQGETYVLSRISQMPDGGGLLAQAAEGAAAACAPQAHIASCVASACSGPAGEEELGTGAAMLAGGCLRVCLEAEAQVFCEARCPLVDEDLDLACIQLCASNRLAAAASCFGGCSSSCNGQGTLELAACEIDCKQPDALLPSGETVDRCRASALAHPPHETAVCLTSCAHDDESCLRACAEKPLSLLPNCVGSCPQNNTRCVEQCIAGRERLGNDCIYPNVVANCEHTSVALGEGSSGVGYGALRNAIAIKFDTWYNDELHDPWLSHVAIHSGGFDYGAPSKATQALGLAYDIPDLNDDKYHEVLVEYKPSFDEEDSIALAEAVHSLSVLPGVAARMTSAQRGNLRYIGVLSVFLDGVRILRVPLNLEELLTLDSGTAYVGFTGATGAAYQEHSVINWRFNSTKEGTLLQPANLHCRQRVPSLWHASGYDGSPLLPAAQALACTPSVMDPSTPAGSMHSLLCTEEEGGNGAVYCRDPNMHNVAPIVHVPIPDVSAHVGIPFEYVLPAESFLDRQSDGRMSAALLNYSISHVETPDLLWLDFDWQARKLSGVPTKPGTWALTAIATDPGFRDGRDPPLSTPDEFLLHVVGQAVTSNGAGAKIAAAPPPPPQAA